MIWFTADTHFGHSKIIQYCNRPFRDVDEMNEELIRRWNAAVDNDDTVYHLGDFSMGDPRPFYARLRGNILIVPGSHDKDLRKLPPEAILPPLVSIKVDEQIIVLCHYAMRSWDRSHYATWHLYGHHHGRLAPFGLSLDVGVDCWSFAPVSLDEIAAKMEMLKPIIDYREKS